MRLGMRNIGAALFVGVVGVGMSGVASAQPCTPAWDGDVPGIDDGYIAPMFERIEGGVAVRYIGGSYTQVAGLSTRGVVRWDTQTGVCSGVGGGCYSPFSNSFSTAILEYNFGDDAGPELVVGGGFATAGGEADTAQLARWNGSRWAGMPGGQPDGAVWAMTVWNGRLYVGGGFTNIGGVAANGIASYSLAEGWKALGTGYGGGFSPGVFALKVYNDGSGEKLYAGGRYSSMGGITGLIARWTGTAWQAVGTGVRADFQFSDVEAFAVHDEGSGPALYAGGYDIRPNSTTGGLSSVVKWNGTTWARVGQHLGGRSTSLISWDDGSGSGAKLYNGGTAQPGIGYIASLQGTNWVTVDGGVTGGLFPSDFPSVFGLAVFGGDLFVGGAFTAAGSESASGLVKRTSCAVCVVDLNGDGVVDFGDYLEFLNLYDVLDPRVDFNEDGIVDFSDYLEFLNLFDAGC